MKWWQHPDTIPILLGLSLTAFTLAVLGLLL